MGLIKLGVIGAIGFDLLDQHVDLSEVPGSQTVTEVASTIAKAVPAQPVPARAADEKPNGEQAASEGPAKPEGMDQADWEALKRKEEELARHEQALKTLERQIDEKIKKISAMEQNIKAMLDEAQSVQDKKFKHLVSVYSNMKAKNAASTLEKLDEKTAVKILSGMRGRKAGEILNFVQPAKAAKLSQELTRMQIPFE